MISEVQAGAGPTYYQDHFRWRNDDGDALSATWKAPQDVAITNVPHYQNIRLRFCISNVGQGFGNYWPDFVYSTSTNGPWSSVGTTNSGEAFEFSDSSWFTNHSLAYNLLTGTGTFTNTDTMIDCEGGGSDLSVAFYTGTYINAELCFKPTAKAKGGTTYYFKLGADIITNYASLTMENYDPPEPPRIVSPLANVTVSVEKVGYGLNDARESLYRIIASGSEPIKYEAYDLPAGWELFGDTIADNGTPSVPGTYTVTLIARNAYGSDTQKLSLAVADSQAPAPRTFLYGEVGKAFSYTLPVAGTAPIGAKLEVTGGVGLPAGLIFDSTSRTISGIPLQGGKWRVVMTATNAVNAQSGSGVANRIIITIADTGGGGFMIDDIQIRPPPEISFDTIKDLLYSVDWSDNLVLPSWHTLIGNISGTGERITVVDELAGGASRRFYRLRIRAP